MAYLARDLDTIVAPATAPGFGAIAVIRVSGSRGSDIVRKIAPFLPKSLESHRVYYGFLKDFTGLERIDEVLITFFAQGRSFTGEDTFEISCHGGPAVVNEILRLLVEGGCRMAEPGEFTYRAFNSGRIDLVQAESILQLVESESPQAVRNAMKHLKGDLSESLGRIENDLIGIQAHLEANIDFAQEDIVIAGSGELIERLQGVHLEVLGLLQSYRSGRLLREGFSIALLGVPNVGKSSLLNSLLRENRAIVTNVPGTTRDPVWGDLMLNGIKVRLIDTAGIREATDDVERIGIKRSMLEESQCDARVLVMDASSPDESLSCLKEMSATSPKRTLMVINKIDLVSDCRKDYFLKRASEALGMEPEVIEVSVSNQVGVDLVVDWIGSMVAPASEMSSVAVVSGRQFDRLKRIETSVKASLDLLRENMSEEFVAAELGQAVRGVHEVLGKVYDDEVMDRVFREFCLGK